MNKLQELQAWKEHLVDLTPAILEQIEWMNAGKVKASVNPACPEKLIPVAERLVELQNLGGEYQRNQISSQDVERIKYFSKQLKIGFDEVVSLAVSNSRYLSKTAIEARGVAGYILEIQSVYKNLYKKTGEFPISAMSAEVKRSCRNFKTDVSVEDKVEAIAEVFLPECKGMKIVRGDVAPKQVQPLTQAEISKLESFFKRHAKNGKVDDCFLEENKQEFLNACKLLQRAGIGLETFLSMQLNFSYSKCYSAQVVPATKQMVVAYRDRHSTTMHITDLDPYLRSKIETAEKIAGKYTIRELLDYLKVSNDNTGEGRSALTMPDLLAREKIFFKALEHYYPNHIVDKNFIKSHSELYEELKLLSSRLENGLIEQYLNKRGFARERFYGKSSESVFYLSERDMKYYGFDTMSSQDFIECDIEELNPKDYFGVYSKLIAQGLDGPGTSSKNQGALGE